MPKQHGMIRVVRIIAIFFVLIGCLVIFWYTPFYSNLVVKALNTFVTYEVDVVAAQSQKKAALRETDNLEPGSDEWIARQAYLSIIETALNEKRTPDLALIQARYIQLKKNIKIEQQQNEEEDDKVQTNIPLLINHDTSISEASSSAASEAALAWMNVSSDEDKELMEKYQYFLAHHPIDLTNAEDLDTQIYSDIAHIQNQNDTAPIDQDKPYAIVILGGGLTLGSNQVDIVVNAYTRLRLEKTLEIEKMSKLPIVLSGVEAPYMQAWLANRGVEANLLENRSMNTCENTRFSSLLLQKKGGAPTVLLVTDRYHMPRTRRLFALNGIRTIPVEAPMPVALTSWQPSVLNYDHSRRANYELLATIRDVLFGSSGCREVP